jgi:pantoate--beta-alanine ligase
MTPGEAHLPTVGVIGLGRVGTVLGAALQRAGYPVVAGHAHSAASRRRAANMLPGVPLTAPEAVAERADLILLTVPDDALAPLAAELATTAIRPGHLVVHTSGRYGPEVLAPVTAAGASPLALHPVMTFTGTALDLPRLAGCPFGVTAAREARPMAEALVRRLGGEPEWILDEDRALYHAAVANGANHLVTLVALSMDLLRQCQVADPGRLLEPILAAALSNVLRAGDMALTGPVARGDVGTVTAHLRALGEFSVDARAAYAAMARYTTHRAVCAGTLDPAAGRRLTAALLAAPMAAPASPGERTARMNPRERSSRMAVDLVRTTAELHDALKPARGTAASVGVVMTMGALHAGHATLIREARDVSDTVVVTIFVNPLQFGPEEDFDRYPRTLEADLEICAGAGADIVFAPDTAELYPAGRPAVSIDPGPMGALLEGASRPGFFLGVLTVVAKLLHIVQPRFTFFGEKDAQQLAMVRAMVENLNVPTTVVGVATQRDTDGLALSSRNAYLTPDQRASALSLFKALTAAADAARAGAGPAAIRLAATAVLQRAANLDPPVLLEYLALVDPESFQDVAEEHTGPAILAVAARVGGTRLIDNVPIVTPERNQSP